MEEFRSKMVQVTTGAATMLEPVEFSGRVSEAELEKWLIANPELSGEPLLVLGSQLAEFAEDKDRLDVLAVDARGEITLLELKVDGAFRLTDLQALAYAAGYAALPAEHFAEMLRRRLEKEQESSPSPNAATADGDGSASVNGNEEVERAGQTLDDAKERIVEFVDVLDEFSEWQPSKRVRIKLVAPAYPKRVLHTVKWLGDVYGMPIEAIQVQLFEDNHGRYQLTFERLLPLKSDDAFDLTIKAAEERIAGTGKSRNPAILKTLLENEIISNGQDLYLHPNILPAELKQVFDPANAVFRVTLALQNGKPMFRWRPAPDAPEELLSPSMAWFSILGAVVPGKYTNQVGSPVYNHYSLEPEGPTLGEIALEQGLW